MTTTRHGGSSPAAVWLQLISALWALAVGPLSLLLLVVAATWEGRLFAVAALLTGLLPLIGSVAWAGRRISWRNWAVSLGLVWIVASVLVLWRAPTGTGSPRSRITHVYDSSQTRFPRYALGNLLPEGDQLLLGFTIMPAFDPILTAGEASRLKRVTAAVYAELDQDSDFHALGSVMPEAYDEMLGLRFARGHCYVYVPPGVDRKRPSPVLVFFHGSGGCFKAYLWILSKVADRTGCIVVAPSCGFGNWRASSSAAALNSALTAASRETAIDLSRVHLAGLSNGGLAVSQLAAIQGSQFRSLIFCSPVFDDAQITGTSFAKQCGGQAVLVLTGAADDRVPLRYVEGNVAAMTQAGAQVRSTVVADADHFLVFTHRGLVITALASWLQDGRGAP